MKRLTYRFPNDCRQTQSYLGLNMRNVLLCMVIALFSSVAMVAQENVLYPGVALRSGLNIGFELGPTYTFFSRTISHTPIENPTSPIQALGFTHGPGLFLRVYTEYRFSDRLAIGTSEGIEGMSIHSSGTGVADCPGNEGGLFDTVDMSVRQTISSTWGTGDLHVRYGISDRVFLRFGLLAKWRLGDVTVTTRSEILGDGECVFDAAGSKVSENSGVENGLLYDLRLGLEAGVGYAYPLSRRLDLLVQGGVNYMVTPASPEGDNGVDEFRSTTLGTLNLNVDRSSMHHIYLGAGLLWKL